MKILEERRRHEPEGVRGRYRCSSCGSLLEVTRADLSILLPGDDIPGCYCLVCSRSFFEYEVDWE